MQVITIFCSIVRLVSTHSTLTKNETNNDHRIIKPRGKESYQVCHFIALDVSMFNSNKFYFQRSYSDHARRTKEHKSSTYNHHRTIIIKDKIHC